MPSERYKKQKEYDKKTNFAAQRKYNQNATKSFTLRFMKSTEADLIVHLEKQDNKAGYIKSLIRKDMSTL